MTLKIENNMDDADGFYAALIAAHDELSEEASAALNARLILILANQVGDRSTLLAAIKLAQFPNAV